MLNSFSYNTQIHLSDVLYNQYQHACEKWNEDSLIKDVTVRFVNNPDTKIAMDACGAGTFPPASEQFKLLKDTTFGKSVQYLQRDYPQMLSRNNLAAIQVSGTDLTFQFR